MVLAEGLPRNALSLVLFSHPHPCIATRSQTLKERNRHLGQITGPCLRDSGADFLRAIAYLAA